MALSEDFEIFKIWDNGIQNLSLICIAGYSYIEENSQILNTLWFY